MENEKKVSFLKAHNVESLENRSSAMEYRRGVFGYSKSFPYLYQELSELLVELQHSILGLFLAVLLWWEERVSTGVTDEEVLCQ